MRKILTFIAALALSCLARGQATQLIGNANVSGNMDFLSGANLSLASGTTFDFGIAGGTNSILYITNGATGNVGALGLGAGMSVVGGNLVAASSTSHNPTALVGTSAINGSAATFMTSDSAPGINLAMVPTMTGLWTYQPTSAITVGSDYGLELIPILNQRNATNFSALLINEWITQAGSGNQYLIQGCTSNGSGGATTNVFDVSNTGVINPGVWNGTAIGSAYGGTGLATFDEGVILAASSANTWEALTPGSSGYVFVSNGAGAIPTYQPIATVLNNVGTAAWGDILERGAATWQYIVPGTSGLPFVSNGTAADPSYQALANAGLTYSAITIAGTSTSLGGSITLNTILNAPGSVAQGDIFYYNGTNWVYLTPGSSGQFLQTQGASANVKWATSGASSSANPSATIGLSAVNGSAGTFMTSDSAPALGVGITPIWTGKHTWALSGGGDAQLLSTAATSNSIRFTLTGTGQSWRIGEGISVTGAFEVYNATLAGPDALSFAPATNNATFGAAVTITGNTSHIGTISTYNNIATAGNGVASVMSAPRLAAQSGAVSLTSYTTPAVDSSYEVSANVNVISNTTDSFSVTCTYTDETNTSRVLTLGFTQLSGATFLTVITNVTGTGPYESPVYHIRCKASTTITFATSGTFTTVSYNIEGTAIQVL